MPTHLYIVARWDDIFETSETRKLESLKWVPVPNKHDGLGFRRVAAHREKCELFTAWNLILQIASKGRKGERGRLSREGRALSAADMSLMTGYPEAIFVRAFTFFTSDVQWLIAEECREISPTAADPDAQSGASPARPADSPALPADAAAEGRKEGIEGMEGSEPPPAAPARSLIHVLGIETLRVDAAFVEAWRDWKGHVSEKDKDMTRAQEQSVLTACVRNGPWRSVEVIRFSIEKGAKNLIWDDAPRSKKPAGQKPEVKADPEGWATWFKAQGYDHEYKPYAECPPSVRSDFHTDKNRRKI